MAKYSVMMSYMMQGTVEIEADDEEQANQKALEGNLPDNATYCKGSAEIDDVTLIEDDTRTCGHCSNFDEYRSEKDGYGGCDANGYTHHKDEDASDCSNFT